MHNVGTSPAAIHHTHHHKDEPPRFSSEQGKKIKSEEDGADKTYTKREREREGEGGGTIFKEDFTSPGMAAWSRISFFSL
jgi:hypothetical protein